MLTRPHGRLKGSGYKERPRQLRLARAFTLNVKPCSAFNASGAAVWQECFLGIVERFGHDVDDALSRWSGKSIYTRVWSSSLWTLHRDNNLKRSVFLIFIFPLLTNAGHQTMSQRDGSTAESIHHSDVAPAVDGEAHRTGRVWIISWP